MVGPSATGSEKGMPSSSHGGNRVHDTGCCAVRASAGRFCRRWCNGLRGRASSIGIEEARMAGSDVDCAVFTNLTRDHLDYHQTMAAAAKAKLFVWPGLRAAVINLDDAFGQQLLVQNHG